MVILIKKEKQMKKTLIVLVLMLTSTLSTLALEKPKVILFQMHGCSACKKFAPTFDQVMSKYSNKFSFSKEDINSSKLADQLGINYVPMVYIIDSDKNTKTAIDSSCLSQPGCFENKLQSY
jgi:thioredoxin-like negative regulator of GroEL